MDVSPVERRHAILTHAAAFVLPIWAPLWIGWRTESSFVRGHAVRALIVQIPLIALVPLFAGPLVGKAVEPWVMVVVIPILAGLAELPASRAASRGEGYAAAEE